MKRRILSFGLAIIFTFGLLPVITGAQTITANNESTQTHKTGKHNGYDYELWSENTGTGNMTLGSGGAFNCNWNNANNILFRTGYKYDRSKKHSEIGEFTIDYKADFQMKRGGVAYLTVYGWFVDPLVEWYILEARGNKDYNPGASGANSVHKGTVEVDGGVYDIYVTERINEPSITGRTTFKQYWSIRKDSRTSGEISVSEHFRAWEKAGMNLGKIFEVSFCVEAWGGTDGNAEGSANVSLMDIEVSEYGAVRKPEDTVVNTDIAFTTADSIKVLKYAVGAEKYNDDELEKYDLNGDGSLTTADVLIILRRIAGA